MQYNYDFEIASLLVMTIIFLHFTFIRQFPSDKTKIFGMLLLTCIAECCINILSSVGLANAALVPQSVNEALAFAFFVLEGLNSYLIFCYFMVLCDFQGKAKTLVRLLGGVPFLLFEVMVILTPFCGFFYYFKDGAYYQGFGAGTGYVYLVYYFILNVVLVFSRRRVVSRRTQVTMMLYTVAAVGVIVVQYRIRGLLLTSAGNTLIIMMTYLAMQNPSEMLDPVTGIGNESALGIQLKNRLNHRTDMAIITINIHKFHHINTVFGMENSDGLLREIGKYLFQLGGKFHVFHNSGNTFTVLADTQEDTERILQGLKTRFRQEWVVQQNHIVVNTAVVVQHYPRDFERLPDYMGMRQMLMEEAKASGAQTVIETDEAFIEKYRRRMQVEMAVGRAIQDRTFQVYYQPIYSLKERRIVSLEALVRLFDEELGFIPPDEFIPMAARDGNIIHIGALVLEECCKFLSRHVLSNVSLGIRTVHVNVSTVQCLRQDLTEMIVPTLEKYHVPPSMITLEITERTAISTPERMQMYMKALGEMGVSFAMDDYGSGNSNCSYLIQFPFQEVKIDKDIVNAYFAKETARIVLENEIRTIQKLGIPLILEGIETKEQSEAMERLGVDYIQGYYYGRPMPEQECLRYIRNFNQFPEDYARQQ